MARRRALFAGVALVLAGPAAAEDGETYRGTMAIIDVTSFAVVASATVGESTPGLAVGFAGYALGSPIVHAAHGRWGTAGLVLGARVGLPAVAMLIGCGGGRGGGDGKLGDAVGCLVGAGLAGAAAVVAAVIIDYAVLAAVDDEPTPMMLGVGAAF